MAEPFDQALRQIELLTGDADADVCLRVIIDEHERKVAAGIAGSRKLEGTLKSFASHLAKYQADGWGIFVVVNGGGHHDAGITEYRALFTDGDGIPLPAEWHIDPDFLVVRDETHWHAYWLLLPGCGREAWLDAMRRLARLYGTDPAICNSSRVMRLAGFLHLKDPAHPKAVTLQELRSRGLDSWALLRSVEDLTCGLPAFPASAQSAQRTGEPVTRTALEEMLAHIDPQCSRNKWLAVAGGLLSANVITAPNGPADATFDALDVFTKWSAGEYRHNVS